MIFQIIIQRASYILHDYLMSLFAIKIPSLSDNIPQDRILHVEHKSHYTYFPSNVHKVLFIPYQLIKSGSYHINQSSRAIPCFYTEQHSLLSFSYLNQNI